jgi:hypothetical protein
MPRQARHSPGGIIYHVLNRAAGRKELFAKPSAESPAIPICPWPIQRRTDWPEWVNQPQTPAEEAALRHCLNHGQPYGAEKWTAKMEAKLGIRPPGRMGRPRKK